MSMHLCTCGKRGWGGAKGRGFWTGRYILRSLLMQLAHHAPVPRKYSACTGYQWDYVFDWTILKHQQSSTSAAAPRPLPVRPEGMPADQPVGEEDGVPRPGGTADSQRRRCASAGAAAWRAAVGLGWRPWAVPVPRSGLWAVGAHGVGHAGVLRRMVQLGLNSWVCARLI